MLSSNQNYPRLIHLELLPVEQTKSYSETELKSRRFRQPFADLPQCGLMQISTNAGKVLKIGYQYIFKRIGMFHQQKMTSY